MLVVFASNWFCYNPWRQAVARSQLAEGERLLRMNDSELIASYAYTFIWLMGPPPISHQGSHLLRKVFFFYNNWMHRVVKCKNAGVIWSKALCCLCVYSYQLSNHLVFMRKASISRQQAAKTNSNSELHSDSIRWFLCSFDTIRLILQWSSIQLVMINPYFLRHFSSNFWDASNGVNYKKHFDWKCWAILKNMK